MVNPLINVYEFFLAIYNALPYSVSAFLDLVLLLLVVVTIVHVLRN